MLNPGQSYLIMALPWFYGSGPLLNRELFPRSSQLTKVMQAREGVSRGKEDIHSYCRGLGTY